MQFDLSRQLVIVSLRCAVSGLALCLLLWAVAPLPARAHSSVAVAPHSVAVGGSALPAHRVRPETRSALTITGTYTFIVTNTGDAGCADDGSAGVSLRCAISLANNSPATVKKVIDFAIPSNDPGCAPFTINQHDVSVCTIKPTTDLPPLNAPMTTINGYTQAGALANTSATADNAVLTIQLDGSSVSGGQQALLLNRSNDVIEGLSITSYGSVAIESPGSHATITGNFLGVTPQGLAGATINGADVELRGGASQVGGTTLAARNVLAAAAKGVFIQSSGNAVRGNLIGLNPQGTAAMPNPYGVVIANGRSNTIGGTTPAARNIISGNAQAGVVLVDTGTSGSGTNGNIVEGNYIGTDVTGTAAIPNQAGIVNEGTGPNTIGGTAAGSGNLISGNTGDGVTLTSGIQVCSGVVVEGNKIGTNAAGTAGLGNATGVDVNGCKNVKIGGTTAAASNLISGNTNQGIQLQVFNSSFPNTGITIEGNKIGANAAGNAAIANLVGVLVSQPNSAALIGGTTAPAANLISGNSNTGVVLDNAHGVTIEGNKIGVGSSGTALANGRGVYALNGATGDTVGKAVAGAGNTIADNTGPGVQIGSSASDTTAGIAIQHNAMHDNTGPGIELLGQSDPAFCTSGPSVGTTPNDLIPCPVITSASPTSIKGTGLAGATIEVYLAVPGGGDSNHGEGKTYVGTATVTSGGTWTLTPATGAVTKGARVTATETKDLSGNGPETSEFALNVLVS